MTMKKYKVFYTEVQERYIVVDAENAQQAEEKCDDFLSGDSDEYYKPKDGDHYEYEVVEAIEA